MYPNNEWLLANGWVERGVENWVHPKYSGYSFSFWAAVQAEFKRQVDEDTNGKVEESGEDEHE